ncbi:MAG: glycosyltransferase family 4 protein [Syntrophomonadaceae bacterium]|nr:glycosyltransferase family 4 protein [Syntrophomonadaceae bacterium]
MRVLMLSWEYPPHSVGGLARHVEGLSIAMAKEGLQVHVLTFAGPKAPLYEVNSGVMVHRVHAYPVNSMDFTGWILQLNLAMLEHAINLVQEQGPFDIIHAHDWLVAFTGRALKHAYQLPLIATIHATEAGRNQGLHNDMQRYISSVEWWLTYEAWRVIVCSESMRHEVQGLFQLPTDKVEVIPNGVDAEKFRTAHPQPQFRDGFAKPWEKVVFFVGRLVREKGVHVLIEAAPKILAVCPEAKFVVAGVGSMENHLKHQAWSTGVGHKFCFTGYIDDTTRNNLYYISAVAAFPSLYEPFGIVALEGMAAGVPVVVSDTGGLGEIIYHGRNGLKAYTGDPNSLAGNIITILKDPAYGEKLREHASRQIDEIYDWQQIVRKTMQLYTRVFKEYRYSSWPLKNGPIQKARRYALSLVGRRHPESVQNTVHHNRFSLVEQRVKSVHYHREGRKGM